MKHGLPDNFRHVRLELAREPGHPAGDSLHGYDILMPLDASDLIDGETATKYRDSCRVRRFRDNEEDAIGKLLRGPGGRYRIDYDDTRSDDDEAGFRFGEEKFVVGEYVSILEDDGDMHTFIVMSVDEL